MIEKKPLRVLFVEDLPTDAELAERVLRKGGLDLEPMRVDTRESFLAALEEFRPDVVISDYSMPVFDGMSALGLAHARDPNLPFIILTGSMHEDTAVECMKAGAGDYVIKEHITRLPFAVAEALKLQKSRRASAEAASGLRESEERYHALFENSHAVMIIIDPEKRTIVEANQAACDFYGWTKETLLGQKMTVYNTLAEDEIERNVDRAISMRNHHFILKQKRSDGSLVDVETHSGPIVLGGRPHLFSIVHDISERVAAERARDDFSSRLDHYLSTSPTVTYSMRIKDGAARWQWASENICGLLGYSLAEVLAPDWWLRNVHTADRMQALGGISKLTTKGSFGQEYRFQRKDRGIVWLRDEMRFVQSEHSDAEIVGTLTDISDRKSAESELSLKSQALDAAANAIVITDRDGAIQWANPAFEALTGYPPGEVAGKNPRLLKSGEQGPEFYRSLWDTILSGGVWRGKLVNKRKDGTQYTEEMTITPVVDESRAIRSFIAIKSDVTERELSEARIRASLDENSVLLREIHHRINNNMQLIISLLSLSSQKIADSGLQKILGEVSRRVMSMSLVHEQFYSSPDMARIDFLLYLRQLADGLSGERGKSRDRIAIAPGSDAVLLTLEKAVPAGLVAAELLSNALTHAYPGGDSAQASVRIALRRVGARIELSVRDEGVGLPKDYEAGMADSLGMILVHSLANQLLGTMEFRGDKGTEAILRFPSE